MFQRRVLSESSATKQNPYTTCITVSINTEKWVQNLLRDRYDSIQSNKQTIFLLQYVLLSKALYVKYTGWTKQHQKHGFLKVKLKLVIPINWTMKFWENRNYLKKMKELTASRNSSWEHSRIWNKWKKMHNIVRNMCHIRLLLSMTNWNCEFIKRLHLQFCG
jgi:hypothetical protein